MRRIAVLLALTMAVPTRADEAPYWLRHWRFGSVEGSPAARTLLARTGADHLALRANGVTDPLGEDCGREVRYDDIRPRGRVAAARHFGRHWRFPAALDRPGAVAGWVRCRDENFAAVAFIRPGLGYRFFEDGLVITLR